MRLAVHLVVVGAKGLHASEQATLGSTADSVAHYPYASYSVLVARPSAQVQPLNIILVVDGSSETWRAVEFLCALSLPDWAKVTMVTVNDERIDIPAYVISQERRQQAGSLSLGPTFAEGYTTTVLERLHKCGTQGWSNVCSGDPVEAILTAAQEQEADLVVIGARGHPCPNPLCLGNVAERVIKNASCSVLAVR
jgi:nucleotide-binding universal stress UspA family protein